MKEFIISNMEAGQRFDKYLAKCLPNAEKGFIYKMLRKKNITLNGKKAEGSEKINAGDRVNIFFSDGTFEKFAGKKDGNSEKSVNTVQASQAVKIKNRENQYAKFFPHGFKSAILYEDDNILIVNKPSGLLSQKAKPADISLIEYITEYLTDTGYLSAVGSNSGNNSSNNDSNNSGNTFKPGICNRLDRNTSGIVVAGKTVKGLQVMSEAFRQRTLEKYYICMVKGEFRQSCRVSGFLYKDGATNKVTVYDSGDRNIPDGAVPIETEYFPRFGNRSVTLLKVHLITGKTHQIRSHLEYLKYPIVGDLKYGDENINRHFKRKYGISNQMLHAYKLELPPLSELGLNEELTVKTEIPEEFLAVLKGENLWEHGTQEGLEALHSKI